MEDKEKDKPSRCDFFAYLDRMKYIKRWQLMHSFTDENIMEHTQQVAMISHALAIISNTYFNGNVSPEKCVMYAMYHECGEVITGDLPTPIKYYNRQISGAYKDLESQACDKLLTLLPEEMRGEVAKYMKPDKDTREYILMKAADRIAAAVKCEQEIACGNNEFVNARASIYEDIRSRHIEEADYFMDNFIKSYSLSLDELSPLADK